MYTDVSGKLIRHAEELAQAGKLDDAARALLLGEHYQAQAQQITETGGTVLLLRSRNDL